MNNLLMQYSNDQLEKVIEEALIYMCACPAQVAEELLNLRKLYAYQRNCISSGSLLAEVHQQISESTQKAHLEMEACLKTVLIKEGWDLTTLTMPANLRQLRQDIIDQEPSV